MGKADNGFPAGLAEFETSIRDEGRKGLEATFKSYDKNGDNKLSRDEYFDPRAK